MSIHEYIGNMHAHTVYSDGSGSHNDIAHGALDAGLDFVVVTDHNVWVDGLDGYRYRGDQRVLLVTGEEIHDQARQPQKNHLLVYETRKELSTLAPEPQALINGVLKAGGLAFLAHPADPAAPLFDEGSLSWVDWDVKGFTGLEIWNFMSQYKQHLASWPEAVYYAFRPDLVATEPDPQVLGRWDRLLASGQHMVAIGGADAHATPVKKGVLARVIFPYPYLFRAINTHVYTDAPLTGEVEADRRLLFDGLGRGRAFVANDQLHPARDFRFTAQTRTGVTEMGESAKAGFGATLQVRLPRRANVRIICHGKVLRTWEHTAHAVVTVNDPGAYRVEARLPANGRTRGWIFSNPIYITD